MINTENYNLSKFEMNDKFSKDYLNENFDLIDKAISDLQDIFNNGASGGALTTKEVVDARGDKETLKERIDIIDEITNKNNSQLIDIEKQQYRTPINILSFEGVDDTEKFQNALNSKYCNFVVPDLTLIRPVLIPWNTGKKLVGIGASKRAVISVAIPSGYENRGAIEYLTNAEGLHNFSGIHFENINIQGNNSVCHGMKLQYVAHPYFNNVIIEGFRGSGLLLDKCQDGTFENFGIQLCGRTTGDYNNKSDVTDNSKTTYAPLQLISTMANDQCNMLRFNNCQFENNVCSPYVRFTTGTGLGITINNLHSEARNQQDFGKFDVFDIKSGEIAFNNCSDSTSRNFIVMEYGSIRISNCHRLGNIRQTRDNVDDLNLYISNSNIANIITNGHGGNLNVSNSVINDISLSYSSRVRKIISGCNIINNVRVDRGETVILDNCHVEGNVSFLNDNIKSVVKNCNIKGNLDFQSTDGTINNNRVSGTVSYGLRTNNLQPVNNSNTYHCLKANIPRYGLWKHGSRIIIDDCTASGETVEYYCIRECNMTGTFDTSSFVSISRIP